MKTTYVTLQQALSLKKLDFDCTELITEGTAKAYGKKSPYNELGDEVNYTTKHFLCWKPTLDYACKWIREYFDIHITPTVTYNKYGAVYLCTVFYIKDDHIHNDLLKDEPLTIDYTPPQIFDTFELAQSAGFDYAIELILKEKRKKFSEKEKEERFKRVEKLKKEDEERLNNTIEKFKNYTI